MFWGLIMEPNKRYTQTVEKAFHVSMATLDVTTADDEIVQVMLCYENRNYLLCNLKKGSLWQNSLDLNFSEGTKIAFTSNGRGHVHLTGYLLTDDELDDEVEEEEDVSEEEEEDIYEEDEEVEEEEVPQLVSKQGKRKAQKSPPETKSTKRLKALTGNKEENSDDENENDSTLETEDTSLEIKDNDYDEEDEDTEVEEEEDSEEDEKVEVVDIKPQQKKNKQQVQQKQQQSKQKNQKDQKLQNNLTNGKDVKAKQVDKKTDQTSTNNSQVQKKKVLTGGIQIEDIKNGHGAIAKQGKFVSVYYVGKLKNGKKFDSTTNGDGFKFRLGKGEVIKGWDIGIQGMKVGGKRRITIPPAMAYGAKGSPPVIPGNSTLTFEVELKNVYGN